jgi:glycosyltransferase involved in cell wall biosynthesis
MKPLFDICLIARNESKTLPKLIDSLSEFQKRGGEILLLDTGSTDGTASKARELGCIVHEVGDKFRLNIDSAMAEKINYRFIINKEAPVIKEGDTLFNFASARNYIAEFASNDMIGTPDCDEIFTSFDIDRINDAIEKGAEQLEYQFVFAHDEEGNPIVQFLHSKFYHRKKAKWVGVIHEVLQGNVKRQYLEESVIKLEHWQNPETNRKGYLKGLAYDCYINPENDRNSHYFAREMMYEGRFNSAIKEFKRHIEMNKWQVEKSQSMIHIGECYIHLKEPEEAVSWFTKAFHIEPMRREPLMKLAEFYATYDMKNAQPWQTIAYATAALQIPQGSFYANYQPYYKDIPHNLLKWAYEIVAPDKARLHSKISILLPTLGRLEGVKKVLKSIENLDYPKELIEVIQEEDTEKIGVPKMIKNLLTKATGDYIVFASNDIEFTSSSIREALKSDKGLIAFNTGEILPDEGNICEHFMIRRDLIEKLGGDIFDTDFHHIGVDNLLWAKAKKLGEAERAHTAIVHHYHFSKGFPLDEVYELGWAHKERDRDLLNKKLCLTE